MKSTPTCQVNKLRFRGAQLLLCLRTSEKGGKAGLAGGTWSRGHSTRSAPGPPPAVPRGGWAAATSGRGQEVRSLFLSPPTALGWPRAGYPGAAAAGSRSGASSLPRGRVGRPARAGRSPYPPPTPHPTPHRGEGSSLGLLGPVAALLVSFPKARPLSFSLPPAL